ncbi:MAG: hypothetical protein DI626_04940 [Micavibrio aeruginosavorus]|uniref:Dienelactone hydrolase domain-containing protein n=1 Tax=Micavibrio aeruginosavorus TaxID=349221 RepID=A0A2W5A3N3_9BACT|nr:MAG: hypothetical protein DI626_04940 [Micavibrio aeruginosavorus]
MKYFLLICLTMFFAAIAQAQDAPQIRTYSGDTNSGQSAFRQAKREKERQPNVEIWLPPEFQSTEQKWPLLVFSHGFGGCAKQSAFLMSYLADNGYIVIAPDHEDAQCAGKGSALSRLSQMRGGRIQSPEKPFRNPELWNDKIEADRKDDLLFAVSSMLDDRQYKNYVDMDRVGLIGHSLGGYTALGIAGAWPSWKDGRFKAVVALSPYLTPYLRTHGIEKVSVPVMYQGGTKDSLITPDLKRAGGAYARSGAPKYFIELEGADHFSWTELDRNYQDIIRTSVLAFVDKYVKGGQGVIDPSKDKRIRAFWKDEGADTDKALNR